MKKFKEASGREKTKNGRREAQKEKIKR